MQDQSQPSGEPLTAGGASTLQVAAWHLQVLLTSIAGFDGKIMFLTALNVAAGSALIGVEIAADPSAWIVAAGLALLGICVLIGLGVLWAAHVQQFPTPIDALQFAEETQAQSELLHWRHFAAVQDAVEQAQDALRRRTFIMRVLLAMTPLAMLIVVAAALTSA